LESRLLAEPILAGRKRELKELELGLEAAIMGKGNTIFISGEAGSGKTRLINEFIDEARKKNVTVLAGWCLSNAAVPYLPFIEAFDYFSSNEESDNAAGSQQLGLKSLLMGPNVNVKTETATRELWKEQAFSAVTKELLEMSTKKPVVLVIEDIHWADSASLSLLHYVSRALIYERILVLATFRNEEPAEPEEGNVHSLADTLRLMGREDLFNEIKLANLSEVDVGRIVESMLRGNVHPELTKKLAKESQGNPLFLVESIKFLFEHKRLVRDDGKWQLTIDKVDIPPKVKDIILRRVMALRPEQRRVLEVASVIGDTFDPELLGDVLNQDSLQVLEVLNAIYQSNSIVRSEERFFRFDHAKSREIIYEKISPPLRKGYHERIGQVLELKSEQQSSTVSDLAYHYTMSGNAPKSIKYSLAAGKDALVRFSNTEAIKHFTYVLQTLPKTRENTEQRTTALEGLGDAFFASMMFKEAVKSFENLANSDGAHKIKALTKAMEAAFFGNDLSRLIALIAEAEKFNVSDPLENARILMNKGRVQLLQGNAPLAVPYYEQSLRVFEEEYQLWDTAWDLIAYGCNAPTIGELHKGLAALFRSIALFKELGDSRWLVEAYNCTGLICAWAFGFWKESRELFEKALDVHERAKIGGFFASRSNMQPVCLDLRGGG
jgi:tetratricopeptide (TPR) repeat protein